MGSQRITSKGFSSRTLHLVNSKSSRCNSPSEALQVSASSVALRPPVPGISELTDTHTQNTRINIINSSVEFAVGEA